MLGRNGLAGLPGKQRILVGRDGGCGVGAGRGALLCRRPRHNLAALEAVKLLETPMVNCGDETFTGKNSQTGCGCCPVRFEATAQIVDFAVLLTDRCRWLRVERAKTLGFGGVGSNRGPAAAIAVLGGCADHCVVILLIIQPLFWVAALLSVVR